MPASVPTQHEVFVSPCCTRPASLALVLKFLHKLLNFRDCLRIVLQLFLRGLHSFLQVFIYFLQGDVLALEICLASFVSLIPSAASPPSSVRAVVNCTSNNFIFCCSFATATTLIFHACEFPICLFSLSRACLFARTAFRSTSRVVYIRTGPSPPGSSSPSTFSDDSSFLRPSLPPAIIRCCTTTVLRLSSLDDVSHRTDKSYENPSLPDTNPVFFCATTPVMLHRDREMSTKNKCWWPYQLNKRWETQEPLRQWKTQNKQERKNFTHQKTQLVPWRFLTEIALEPKWQRSWVSRTFVSPSVLSDRQ